MTERVPGLPLVCALLLGAVLLAEAVLRPRAGSPDAYQYLDVASNLAEGRGLVQSVPGYNSPRFPVDVAWPQPFTSQPPLYPWLASLAIRAGAEPTTALATLVAAGVVVTWLAGAWLAAALWGGTAGVLALGGLAACSLSPALTSRVWSDPVAIALATCALAAVLRAGSPGTWTARWAMGAGALAGLAFLTRYVCGLLFPFGAVWLLCRRPGLSRWREALAFVFTAAVFAAPLLARNFALAGGGFGEPRNPSTQDLAALVSNALHFTWGRLPQGLRVVAVLLAAGVLIATLASRERRARLRETISAGAALLPAWGLTYALAIVALRLRVHFDNVGVRLLAPALVAAALLAAGVASRLLSVSSRMASFVVSLTLLAATVNVGLRIRDTPAPQRLETGRSEFLRWLAAALHPSEVLIAEDAVDLAWALRREPGPARRVVSFSPAPYMRALTQGELARFAERWSRSDGQALRLVVRGEEADDAAWRRRYGDPIADAVAGRRPAGDGLVLERVIDGKRVLRWRSASELREGTTPKP